MRSRPTSVEPVKLADLGVCAEFASNGIALGRVDQVDHAFGKASLMRKGEHCTGNQRRLFSGFQHDRAARRQGRRDLARHHGSREIPWRNRADDADRLLDHQQATVCRWRGDGLALDAIGSRSPRVNGRASSAVMGPCLPEGMTTTLGAPLCSADSRSTRGGDPYLRLCRPAPAALCGEA